MDSVQHRQKHPFWDVALNSNTPHTQPVHTAQFLDLPHLELPPPALALPQFEEQENNSTNCTFPPRRPQLHSLNSDRTAAQKLRIRHASLQRELDALNLAVHQLNLRYRWLQHGNCVKGNLRQVEKQLWHNSLKALGDSDTKERIDPDGDVGLAVKAKGWSSDEGLKWRVFEGERRVQRLKKEVAVLVKKIQELGGGDVHMAAMALMAVTR